MLNGDADRRPVPDPTVLTTEQLQREIAALRDLIYTRLDAMDTAIKLLADGVNKVPSETTSQVSHLKELIFTRFSERDLRVQQAALDSRDALEAARSSAQVAIAKAEESLNKRFDIGDASRVALEERVRQLMPRSESEALHKSHTDHIAALSARLEAREERGKGMTQGLGVIITIVTVAAAVLGIVLTVINIAGR